MKKICILLTAMGLSSVALASIIMEDLFDDGTIETSTQLNGGFDIIGSGGSIDESDGKATISNAPNGSEYGMLGNKTFSLGGQDTLKTTWVISDSSLKNNAESLVFTWQTGTTFSNHTPTISLVIDVSDQDNPFSEFFVNGVSRSAVDLHAEFGATNDQFYVHTTFSTSTFLVDGTDALRQVDDQALLMFGAWDGDGQPNLDGIRVGAFVNGKSKNGLVVEFDSVTVEAIPEPAVIAFIGIFGGALLVARRWFNI